VGAHRIMPLNGMVNGAPVTVGGVLRRLIVAASIKVGTSLCPAAAVLVDTIVVVLSSWLSSLNVRDRRRNVTRIMTLGLIIQGKLLNEIEITYFRSERFPPPSKPTVHQTSGRFYRASCQRRMASDGSWGRVVREGLHRDASWWLTSQAQITRRVGMGWEGLSATIAGHPSLTGGLIELSTCLVDCWFRRWR
jgi:hypothetical protein